MAKEHKSMYHVILNLLDFILFSVAESPWFTSNCHRNTSRSGER